MKKLWARLEAVANEWGRPLRLREPASKRAIAAAEKHLGVVFPADFRESLLLHDGQWRDDDEILFEWVPGCERLATLEEMMDQWDLEQRATAAPLRATRKAIRERVLVHSRRIPIAGAPDWVGSTYMDFIPGTEGTEGQLVTRVGASRLVLTTPGFRAALQRHLDWLADDTATIRGSQSVASAFAAHWLRRQAE